MLLPSSFAQASYPIDRGHLGREDQPTKGHAACVWTVGENPQARLSSLAERAPQDLGRSMVRRRARPPAPNRPDGPGRDPRRRPRPRAAAGPGAAGETEDEQPRARPLGLHRAHRGGRRADDPGDRDGRAQRRDRAGGPGRARREARGAGRHLRCLRCRGAGRRAAAGRPLRSRPPAAPPRSASPSASRCSPDRRCSSACAASWAAKRGRRRSPASTRCRPTAARRPGPGPPTCRRSPSSPRPRAGHRRRRGPDRRRSGGRRALGDEELESAATRAGRAAAKALSNPQVEG